MSNTKIIEVSARSGGMGTTTVSCILATTLSDNGKNVAVIDESEYGNAFSTFGMPYRCGEANAMPVRGNIFIYSYYPSEEKLSQYDFVVIDAGVRKKLSESADFTVSVARSNYNSLKSEVWSKVSPDATVVAKIPNSVLNESDITSVLNREITFIDVSEQLARTLDAGLLLARPQHYEWAQDFIDKMTRVKA